MKRGKKKDKRRNACESDMKWRRIKNNGKMKGKKGN